MQNLKCQNIQILEMLQKRKSKSNSAPLYKLLEKKHLLIIISHLNTISTFLSGRLSSFLSKGKITLDHLSQTCNIGALTHVPVLEQTFLGHMRLLQIHT